MYNLAKLQSSELTTLTDNAQQRVEKWTKLKLDGNRLQSLTASSSVVAEFFEYLEYHNRDKTFLDNIPYIGKALKNNRYSKMTIEEAVEKFANHIANINKVIVSTTEWLQTSQTGAYKDLQYVNLELEKIKETVIENEENDTSRINTLKYKKSNGLTSHEESHELTKLLQNIEILKGEMYALETHRNGLQAKYDLFDVTINNAIKIQGKAKRAEALPAVLRVALEAINSNEALRSALGGLKDSESVVKMLMGQAVVSANNLTAEAKQIQQQAIEFQTCLSGLKELKDNVDDVLVTFS